MLFLLFVVIAAGCVALELPALIRKRRPLDLIVYSLFWLAGLAATACSVYKINMPSPLLLVVMIYKPFNDLFTYWFL
ncbi:hypothetical protein [Paenibacillus sp. HW567]|uniref:hypothetical protein n=1 Tax=Paenibacillus sp. HW567 TaxID=1034769 RepID=UPI0003699E35|nr:hypothetical protein [Paenibacillus sp. HW567]